jgi:hypothetical protein
MRFERTPDLGDKLLEAIKPKLGPKLRELEEQLSAEVREIIGQVTREMSGRPADQVLPELRARVLASKPGLKLNEEKFRSIAKEISAGTAA